MTSKAGHTAGPDRHRLPDGRVTVRAHDIRHLCLCGLCGGIADERTSISYNVAYRCSRIPGDRKEPDVFWHPACCYEHFGEKVILEMPESEQEKFCLSDIPASVMVKLLEQSDAGRAAIAKAEGGANA